MKIKINVHSAASVYGLANGDKNFSDSGYLGSLQRVYSFCCIS